jgi:hypothetical protein
MTALPATRTVNKILIEDYGVFGYVVFIDGERYEYQRYTMQQTASPIGCAPYRVRFNDGDWLYFAELEAVDPNPQGLPWPE